MSNLNNIVDYTSLPSQCILNIPLPYHQPVRCMVNGMVRTKNGTNLCSPGTCWPRHICPHIVGYTYVYIYIHMHIYTYIYNSYTLCIVYTYVVVYIIYYLHLYDKYIYIYICMYSTVFPWHHSFPDKTISKSWPFRHWHLAGRDSAEPLHSAVCSPDLFAALNNTEIWVSQFEYVRINTEFLRDTQLLTHSCALQIRPPISSNLWPDGECDHQWIWRYKCQPGILINPGWWIRPHHKNVMN